MLLAHVGFALPPLDSDGKLLSKQPRLLGMGTVGDFERLSSAMLRIWWNMLGFVPDVSRWVVDSPGTITRPDKRLPEESVLWMGIFTRRLVTHGKTWKCEMSSHTFTGSGGCLVRCIPKLPDVSWWPMCIYPFSQNCFGWGCRRCCFLIMSSMSMFPNGRSLSLKRKFDVAKIQLTVKSA